MAATLRSTNMPAEMRSTKAAASANATAGSSTALPAIPTAFGRSNGNYTATLTNLQSRSSSRASASASAAAAESKENVSLPPSRPSSRPASGPSSRPSTGGGLGGLAGGKDWNLWNGQPEAQWILSVLDDCLTKLTLSSFLTPEILKDRALFDRLSNGNPELYLTLQEHFNVEKQYQEFLESDVWKLAAHEARNQELFAELDMCLADSTRTVTRLLKQNPQIVRRMRELAGTKRSQQSLDFLHTFSRLRQLTHAKLRMSAEEERAIRDQLAELRALEEEDTAKFVDLTQRLAVERHEHESALAAKDAKIQRLTAQISQLTQRTEQERKMFMDKMKEENDNAERIFRQQEKELMKQLEAMTGQLQTDGEEHFRTELVYHRKKNLRAADVSQLIDKYDMDMQLKHESTVDMVAVHNKEKAELDALNGYFATVDAEARAIEEEKTRIRGARDRELQIERKQQQAALLVQTMYKGYYSKVGPKEPKAKKAKKKKDPFAAVRNIGRQTRAASAQPAETVAASSAPSMSTTMQSDVGPMSSGPEDSEGEATQA